MNSPVLVTDAVAGMMLGDALHDDTGKVLLPAGCVLTLAILQALARRGVTHITISDAIDAAATSVATSSAAPSNADIAARIDHVFRRGDSAAQTELKTAIRAFRLSATS